MTVPSAIKSWLEETSAWPRDPLRYHVEFPYHGTYYPFGLPLEISTNDRRVLATAEETWGALSMVRSVPKIHLQYGVFDTGNADLPRPPTFRAHRGLITLISDSENFGVCDVTGGFGFSWVSSAAVGDSAFFRYHFLDVMAGLLLTPVHYAIVHAACVAYNGHGILLCGHSGAGKSSLAFACARRGWTFVFDDAGHAPLWGLDRTVIGNPRFLRFRKDAAELFPELRDQAVVLRQNGEFGFEILTHTFPGISTTFQTKIDHIVFLNRHAEGPGKLLAFPKEDAQRWFEHVLEYTLACNPACDGIGYQRELALKNSETREEQRAAISRLLAADVHELHYSGPNDAVGCLEPLVQPRET